MEMAFIKLQPNQYNIRIKLKLKEIQEYAYKLIK